jgi:hypothetical protein
MGHEVRQQRHELRHDRHHAGHRTAATEDVATLLDVGTAVWRGSFPTSPAAFQAQYRGWRERAQAGHHADSPTLLADELLEKDRRIAHFLLGVGTGRPAIFSLTAPR